MKKFLKIAGSVVVAVVTIISIIKLVQLIRKYSFLGLLKGLGILGSGDEDIVDVSDNETKFLVKKSQEGLEAFNEYLDMLGYKYIGQFGSSNLYEHEGTEIVIKKSKLFNKYYLFEIFNEQYFEDTADYILA